ncbi:MAG: cyclic nucleotide-binding domain-containing protein, partial [Desulfobulbaceae bacterium]|nr:cyclic nucleotide-binding domain-containing protein [Desulfobulbaceae bacterium]
EFYKRVREEYLTPVTLKKIDIGGGLIHGRAEDFRSDRTERIILAHTAVPLTDQQKEIGSSAPFGIVDVLIPDYSDLTRRIASVFLEAYFPSAPSHYLKILLNNQVVNFKSGSIILKEGTINKEIYLLLTGTVEMLQSKYGIYNILSSGEVIGEHSGLNNCPSITTYRAVSYAYAMRIPNTMYLNFVKQNKLYTKIERLHENKKFLQRTWLFGESIASATQNGIAEKMKLHHFDHSDETLADLNSSSIYIVKSGSLKRVDFGDNEPAVNTGDFFGAEPKGYLPGSAFSFRTLEPSTVYEIPCDVFKGIPIILWKLLETYGKRMMD